MTDPAASTNLSSYHRRFRLGIPVVGIQLPWAPALAVRVDSRADQTRDELWNRDRKLVNKEVKFASSKAR
jgi:hypothetical protein